ncbi:MAG: 3'-5' exonuclease [Candidatus Marinimicrobia bacterium]|nr:3'-5' exonuclease [Candidatus Neomarinimicrobiota bacterium]MDD5582187.1 3'-5' exonuclease [Candidatus Neomarinimicrobiota bacterium]
MTHLLENLNPPQREAVLTTEGPLLIFAGAGSGKTRVLIRKIAYLLEQKKTVPERILAVTFTNKAAGEMRIRLNNMLGSKADRVTMGTFHSINARFLRKEAHRLGYTRDFTIYDSDDSLQLIRAVMNDLTINAASLTHHGMKYFISDCKQNMLLPHEAKIEVRGDFLGEKKVQIYHAYQQRLKNNNAMDFDDLLIMPLFLFKQFPDVLTFMQYRWDYILVDEYQDTNRAQFLFLQAISERHHNICVVGDDDQSIYGWRGADIRNILEFEQTFPNATVIKLEQNYRSTGMILKAASALVKKNKNRKDKTLWTKSEEGEKIIFHQASSDHDEANYIAKMIKENYLKGFHYRDHAILYRTNAQSRQLEEALINRQIRYIIVGGTRFYDRKEIKDILAYLRVLVNPKDQLSLKRIINSPARGIGKTSLERLEHFANETHRTLWEALQYPDEAGLKGVSAHHVKNFLSMMLALKERLNLLTLTDGVIEVLEKTGYKSAYEMDNASKENEERLKNLEEFVNSASEFEQNNEEATLENFLQDISLLTDIDQWEDAADAVVLMTLHSAKGLEFPIVFISGLEDGLFPLERAKKNDDELEEERRLFYVGITRAMKRCILTCARQRRRYGNWMPSLPSSFIDDIPLECLKKTGFTKKTSSNDFLFGFNESEITPTFRHRSPQMSWNSASSSKRETKKGISLQLSPSQKICVGDCVMHKIFGKGKVLEAVHSSQPAFRVAFQGGVVKIIAAKFLQLLE